MATITKHRFEMHPDMMKHKMDNEEFIDRLYDISDLVGCNFTFHQDWDNGIIIIITRSTNDLKGLISVPHKHYITEV